MADRLSPNHQARYSQSELVGGFSQALAKWTNANDATSGASSTTARTDQASSGRAAQPVTAPRDSLI